MASLSELIEDPSKRNQIIDDCVKLVDEEVGDKGGLSGIVIKTVLGAVKGAKPGFVRGVVSSLLPEFVAALNPLFMEAQAAGKTASSHFAANPSRVSGALLGITDAKVRDADSAVVKTGYEKLRGTAPKHIESAIPRLGALLDRHNK